MFSSNRKEINEKYGYYDVEKENKGFYDPVSMELSPKMQLIEGFKEAIYTMNVGDIIYCYIPSDLAYGSESKGNLIAPNSDLTFIIQMITAEN
jgi:peptidyl-prolyl cis-trans isomerase A (cyclophilin A)